MPRPARRTAATGAFTLLEMLAVLAILALLATLVLPGIGTSASRELGAAAQRIAADLELARQRTVMTGASHRLWLDLDGGQYRLEWQVSEARAKGEAPAPVSDEEPGQIDLSPPRDQQVDYYPLSSAFGRDTQLPDEVSFQRVEAAGERHARGEIAVRFDVDGTTEATDIVLEDADGGRVRIEVLALADAVRVLDEE